MNSQNTVAWETRDQADQAELHYNQPLRVKNRRLEDENMALKRLLRENGISWQAQPKTPSPLRVTRSATVQSKILPYLPVEIQLRILSYALTSPHPIIDPLCKTKSASLLATEKVKKNYIAIHFLATCKAYAVEGTRALWSNNTFVFTSPDTLRNFAELDLIYRQKIEQLNIRLIAKFYDDETRSSHKLSRSHHPDLRHGIKLVVHRRPKENTLARRGFRAYAWYQLIDFLEAMLPPHDPSMAPATASARPLPRPKLLPSLKALRIDFVNFGEDIFQYPPTQLHDLASHQLGCTLNEVILTGLPTDESGMRVSTELSGLLRDEGLIVDHAPTLIALKNGLRQLKCDDDECHYSAKIVRGMRTVSFFQDHFPQDHPHSGSDFPPAPKEDGQPPFSPSHSCRTIWKRIPKKLDGSDERKWELFDRLSGLPWEDVEDEATLFDNIEDDEEGSTCENCGEVHPGALLSDEMMDLYDDL
ncbi:hypothetical protein GGR56DRAFT_320883 [Xylariaceae sp. FL0804]|nr:hypothetical protein GGR56DRAFT_320883 [Xylariaceae sp. FL0804]